MRAIEPEMLLQIGEQEGVARGRHQPVPRVQAPPLLPLFVQPVSGSQQATRDRLAHNAGLAQTELEPFLELFPDARHADEEARRDLAHVLRDGVDALGKVDRTTEHEMHRHGVAALCGMAERQISDGLERLVERADGLGVGMNAADDIPMRQHRALGFSRGPGSVDDQRHIIR